MKILLASVLALGLAGAAISATSPAMAAHGGVYIQVDDHHRHHGDRWHDRSRHDGRYWHHRRHERWCRDWGRHHHGRYCRNWGWRWVY
jgi:hypothetical protein